MKALAKRIAEQRGWEDKTLIPVMRLRTELELALGPDFNELEFHDFILQQGLLPPDLLRETVLQHFVEGADKKP